MNIFFEILLWATYIIALYFSIFWMLVFFDRKKHFENEKIAILIKKPFVSVLIPAYNEKRSIEATIKSVINLDYPKDKIEIIVINDGSKDNTKEIVEMIIRKNKPRKIILLNQKNHGKARALNNGLKIAKGEFFACLDADSFVEKNSLKKMLSVYEKNGNKLAIVTPTMKVKSPKTLVQKIQRAEYIFAILMARMMSSLDCIYVAPGPFSLYRTKVIKKLGGFDENNLTEDMEIAYRLQKHNYLIKQCPGADVFTLAPKTVKSLYNQRNRWFKGGLSNVFKYKGLLLNKNYGDFGMMQMPMNLLYVFLSATMVFFFFYYVMIPFFKMLHDWYLVGFDFKPYLKDVFKFDFNFINFNFDKGLVIYLLFVMFFMLFYFAHRNSKEKIKKLGWFYLLPYFFIYYTILSFVVVIVIFESIIGKKQKW